MRTFLQNSDLAARLLNLCSKSVVLFRLLLQLFIQEQDRPPQFLFFYLGQAHLRFSGNSFIARRFHLACALLTLLLEKTLTLKKLRQSTAVINCLHLIMTARFLRALSQRTELHFDLLHDVADTHKIALHILELSQ